MKLQERWLASINALVLIPFTCMHRSTLLPPKELETTEMDHEKMQRREVNVVSPKHGCIGATGREPCKLVMDKNEAGEAKEACRRCKQPSKEVPR